jgi:EmrB/QacA subfamily drug resistance transporter
VRAAVTETSAPQGDAGLRIKSAQGRWVVAATVLGSGIAALDATVVGIALPAIGRDFHTGVSSVQWVVDAYTLTLAGLLLLGGTLGDSYGRRKVFAIGVAWFAVASLLCGVAPNVQVLIAARALQGVGGALLTPGSLAILQASFAQDDRAAAIGAWSGLGGLATAIGPFLGGYLIGALSWRLVFYINLPLAVFVLFITARHVPETKAPGPAPKLDIRGAVSISGALAGITYGLIAASSDGWGSVQVLVPLAVGAVLMGVFIWVEDKEPQPMLPLGVFRSRQFSAANAVTFVVYAALSGLLFLVPTVLQVSSGYSPLAAGASLLPVTFIMLTLSSRSGALAARIGPRLQMSTGPLVIAASFLLFTRLGGSGNYLSEVLPAVLVFGLGVAIMVAPLTATAMAAAPADHAGVASAVNNDVARAAGLIAVAVLPALAGITGNSYLHPAALAHGFRVSAVIAAVFCVAGGVLAALTIRNPSRSACTASTPNGPHCALEAPPLRSSRTPNLEAVPVPIPADHEGPS